MPTTLTTLKGGVAAAVLAASFCGWAGATVRAAGQASVPALMVPAEESSEAKLRESLRRDVERHPGDFVAFPTETAAIRFLREHVVDTSRETVPRMRELGVVGYWQGRTVVVVPIAPMGAR